MNNTRNYLCLILIWSLAPIFWQAYTSFCTPEALIYPLKNISNRWTLENYTLLLSSNPSFLRYLLNSTIVGISTTFLTLLLAIPAAYSISKIKPIIAGWVRLFLLSAALFPYVLLFLSLLEIARALNIGNNLFALSIPYSALNMPLALLLLSSSFKDLPIDLEEAARLEGLNLWQRLRWILIPLIAPATASTSILIFIFSWNEYPIALTWISKTELLTLPVAISRIAGSSVYSVPYGAYAAATVLGSIPLLLIVIIFQKQIVSGLTKGAVKG